MRLSKISRGAYLYCKLCIIVVVHNYIRAWSIAMLGKIAFVVILVSAVTGFIDTARSSQEESHEQTRSL